MKKLCFWVVLLSVFSCGFNRMYYVPYPIEINQKARFVNKVTNDTVFVTFDQSKSPLFLDSRGSAKQHNYTVTDFRFKIDDREIFGWTIYPNKTLVKAKVLFLHGNAGNLLYQFQSMIPLVEKGYQVHMIDYSGFGFSGGKPTRTHVLEDGLDALEYVFKEDVKNGKSQQVPLVIYGQSLGGHLACVVAAKKPDLYDALVIEGAFSSHKDIAAKGFGFLGRIFVKEGYAGYRYISKVKKPVLIIHSTEDKTIPFSHGEKLFKYANEPKYFYEIKGPHIAGSVLYVDSIDVKIGKLIREKN